MKRLPVYDAKTSSGEVAAFCGLALAAGTLTITAVWNGSRFANNESNIVAALCHPTMGGETQVGMSGHQFTNLVEIEAGGHHPCRVLRPGGAEAARGQSL